MSASDETVDVSCGSKAFFFNGLADALQRKRNLMVRSNSRARRHVVPSLGGSKQTRVRF